MDSDEPQEWYHLIRKRLRDNNFPGVRVDYTIHYLEEMEYKRLYQQEWVTPEKTVFEYNAEKAAKTLDEMQQYFKDWPL